MTKKIFLTIFSVLSFIACSGGNGEGGKANTDIAPTAVSLNKTSTTIEKGKTESLTATIAPSNSTSKVVKWSSSDTNVASVNLYGTVTAIGIGNATITAATAVGDKKATCNVSVVAQLSKVIVSGYIPEYKISSPSSADLTYLSKPTRVYFFGYYPDATGAWQLSPTIAGKLQVVRSNMTSSQELFIVAGGGATATPNMHVMGTDQAKREAYATALVNYAHANNFDGIDMDWETDWSKVPAVKVGVADFLDLMTRIRNKMNALPANTKVKKLTTALATQQDSRDLAFAVKDIVDQINVMVYDVYGTQEQGYPHAPYQIFTTAMENYVAAGIPKSKLIGGVPFYGGTSPAPRSTRAYNLLYSDSNGAITAATDSYNGYAFNGVNLITQKTDYIINNGYAGVMIWELSHDLPYSSPLSLLKAIKSRTDN